MSSLGQLLAFVLSVSLLAAVSPLVFLNAVTAVSTSGVRKGWHFFAGNALILFLVGIPAMGVMGAWAADFAQRQLTSRAVDGVLGAALLVFVGVQWGRTHQRKVDGEHGLAAGKDIVEIPNRDLFTWGVLGMATNFPTLLLFMSASQRIGASQVHVITKIILWLLSTAIALAPVWGPIVAHTVHPESTHLSPEKRATITKWAAIVSMVACLIAGLVLVIHAIFQ